MFNTDYNNFRGDNYKVELRDQELKNERRRAIHQRLWNVHDSYVEDPTQRFQSTRLNVLIEQNCESGYGPMGNSSLPEEMVTFVRQMLTKFRVEPCRVEVEDTLYELMYHLDFNEPYFLFVDSAIVLKPGEEQLKKSFKLKESGRTIEPDSIEVFEINKGWSFAPYTHVMAMIQHPLAQRALDGYDARSPVNGQIINRTTILDKIIESVWGHTHGFYYLIEEIMERRYDDELYSKSKSPEEAENASLDMEQDTRFMAHAMAAGMLWLRSPRAVYYLIQTHPIYATLLDWNESAGHPTVAANTDGVAFVTNWDVYTKQHVHVIDAPAGTCEKCAQTVHCTKFVNVNALRADPCICGHVTDPLDTDLFQHRSDCPSKKDAKFAFVCLKCMYDITYASQLQKCGRAVCPNTNCGWHMGASARIRALTEKRKLMLTGPSA